MGLLLDSLEDANERLGAFIQAFGPNSGSSSGWGGPPAEEIIGCPVCGRRCVGQKAFLEHVRSRHADQRVYLRLNGQILRGGSGDERHDPIWWEIDGVRDCVLELIGEERAEVRIVAGREDQSIQAGPGADLCRFIAPEFRGEVRITVRLGTAPRHRFRIFCREAPHLDLERVDVQLNRAFAEIERTGRAASITELRRAIRGRGSRCDLEERYSDGFLEYIQGVKLELGDRFAEAGSRFEDALGMLAPFSSALARTASLVLAFKLNAFSLLQRAPEGSWLHPASRFFGSLFGPPERCPVAGRVGAGVYVDPFTIGCLEAIADYGAGHPERTIEKVRSLGGSPLAAEANNLEKLHLIKAKALVETGRREELDAELRWIAEHSIRFGSEARERLRR